MLTLYLHLAKLLMKLLENFKNDFLILDGFSTTSLYCILTNVILWFLEHLILYSALNANITIKNNASKKLLAVCKLTACIQANLKLHALNRIIRFLSPEQHVLITTAYIKSLFHSCPLVWMIFYRGIMHEMNKIHEWSLRLLLKNYKDDFQDLLRSSGDISIHQRCINSLLNKVYKCIHGLSPKTMNEVFSTRVNIYNTQ